MDTIGNESAAAGDGRRFDRSSWIVVGIALGMMIVALLVSAAAYRVPGDGWVVERGEFGRYEPIVFVRNSGIGSTTLRQGDVLLAVEGIPFEVLERRAARLAPTRPPNWRLGSTVRYTVLRDGAPIDIDITLVQSPILLPYKIPFLADLLGILVGPTVVAAGVIVFLIQTPVIPAKPCHSRRDAAHLAGILKPHNIIRFRL